MHFSSSLAAGIIWPSSSPVGARFFFVVLSTTHRVLDRVLDSTQWVLPRFVGSFSVSRVSNPVAVDPSHIKPSFHLSSYCRMLLTPAGRLLVLDQLGGVLAGRMFLGPVSALLKDFHCHHPYRPGSSGAGH